MLMIAGGKSSDSQGAGMKMIAIPQAKSLIVASACALALSVAAAPAQALSTPGPQRLAVTGSHPGWATAPADAGQVPAAASIDARVYLAGRDPAGLAAYAAQVSNPRSASYGRYPDIAADADPATGMLIGLTAQTTATSPPAYTEVVAGGTSESSPLIAGIQADAQQAQRIPIGFADPAIYQRYDTRAYHTVTDDPLGPGVTIASVDALPSPVPSGEAPDYLVTMAHDTSLHAMPGYNDITGVGTPAPGYLRSYLRR
jgi:hypothetical protein